MPELFVDVAERIVVRVTALPGTDAGEPCADTLALKALGLVLVAPCGSARRPGRARRTDAGRLLVCTAGGRRPRRWIYLNQ
ncbi:hypothetical protein [Streptomyces sp. NPDC051452]|uniref:hypothetical protein n=1 Tax=Streptomyces sp. NPDC051452 TaxID=3365654 RepID=UPI00378A3359